MGALWNISIHAPPRGATRCCQTDFVTRCISIHAPPRGATRWDSNGAGDGQISIHAPPRGATQHHSERRSRHFDFNSRPSARGDDKRNTVHHIWSKFQFTPLREGRLRTLFVCQGVVFHFNSRPSARGDSILCQFVRHFLISIHAPPRGATVNLCILQIALLISIHAPPRGATALLSDGFCNSLYFNSRPSARGDLYL